MAIYSPKIKKSSRSAISRSGFKYCEVEPSGAYHAASPSKGKLLRENGFLLTEVKSNTLHEHEARTTQTEAKYHSAKNMAKLIHALTSTSGADPTVVEKVASYTTKFNYDMGAFVLGKFYRNSTWVTPKFKGQYMYKLDPSRGRLRKRLPIVDGIWVSRSGYLGDIPSGTMLEVSNAAHRTLLMVDKSKSYSMGITYNLTARDILVYLHELGHSAHTRSKYAGVENSSASIPESEWESGLTEYGKTNFEEGFAEFFVAYVAAGKELKRQFPSIFAFIDKAMDLAHGDVMADSTIGQSTNPALNE
jgi:hypothetical protein